MSVATTMGREDYEFTYRHAFNYAYEVAGLGLDDAESFAHWTCHTYIPDYRDGDTNYSHRDSMRMFLAEHPDVEG